MKRIILILTTNILLGGSVLGQIGIKTPVPLTDLHLNGNIQIAKDIRVGGGADSLGDPGSSGQVLKSNGPDVPAEWVSIAIPEIPDHASGTLIAIDGKMQIAEEMTYLMSGDFKFLKTMAIPTTITTINNKIIDTYGNFSNGAFKVADDGIYLVTLNVSYKYNDFGTSGDGNPSIAPVFGIWDDSYVDNNGANGRWLARISEEHVYRNVRAVTPGPNPELAMQNIRVSQIATLITAVNLKKNTDYSIRLAPGRSGQDVELTVEAFSAGNTGSGPVSYYSIKRLN